MIIYCRVDDRVVHGQTITTLLSENPCDGILIVDDEIAVNETMKQIYKNVVPRKIKLFVFTCQKALIKLPEAQKSEKRYFVIFKKVETVERLMDGGFQLPIRLNVGPASSKIGTVSVMKGLYLSEKEMKIYSRITDSGIDVVMQPIFTHPKEYWRDLRKKFHQ